MPKKKKKAKGGPSHQKSRSRSNAIIKVLYDAILLTLTVHLKVKFDLDRSTKKLPFKPFKYFFNIFELTVEMKSYFTTFDLSH